MPTKKGALASGRERLSFVRTLARYRERAHDRCNAVDPQQTGNAGKRVRARAPRRHLWPRNARRCLARRHSVGPVFDLAVMSVARSMALSFDSLFDSQCGFSASIGYVLAASAFANAARHNP